MVHISGSVPWSCPKCDRPKGWSQSTSSKLVRQAAMLRRAWFLDFTAWLNDRPQPMRELILADKEGQTRCLPQGSRSLDESGYGCAHLPASGSTCSPSQLQRMRKHDKSSNTKHCFRNCQDSVDDPTCLASYCSRREKIDLHYSLVSSQPSFSGAGL